MCHFSHTMSTSFCNKLSFRLCILLLLISPVRSLTTFFRRTHFEPADTKITYEGDAKANDGIIEFNTEPFLCEVGKATYSEKVRIWDSNTRSLSDFSTHFSFIINNTENHTSLGSGLAFFLAPVGFRMPPNSAGGFLGLYNMTTSDSNHNKIVHIEFDTDPNSEWDPEVQHVGINNNSISPANYTSWNASLHRGDTADVWITYSATTKNLSVSWKYQRNVTPEKNTSLSYVIDLREALPEMVNVGFTAARGNTISAQQVILSWEFNSTLEINEATGKNAVKKRLALGLPISVGLLTVAVITASVLLRRQKAMRKETTEALINLTSLNTNELERNAGPRKFAYKDLVQATNNFSGARKLGEGGFGSVYRGYLSDLDMMVAVKKISNSSRQGRKEYITEVKTISQLRHRNLVQLLGWCHDRGDFLLVYEFMANSSLDFHLFGTRTPLTWPVRYRIALGLASSLLYLHEECEQCVVHRDIKSSNVMLDSSFNAKLGDFGFAKLIDHGLGPQPTGLAGTRGYMAPEYLSTGEASKESDVYSFGVVALEIATGRKATGVIQDRPGMSLIEWAWDLHGRGKLMLAVDERLEADLDDKQFECLVVVGLWCAHPDYNLRPSIRQAIQAMNFGTNLLNLSTNMPVPFSHSASSSVHSGRSLAYSDRH